MLRAENLFANCQRALEERSRHGEIALVPKQDGKIVEERSGIGMLGAKNLLANG
jgi:hypothetical protein